MAKNFLDELKRREKRIEGKVETLENKYRDREHHYTFHAGFGFGHLKGKLTEIKDFIEDLKGVRAFDNNFNLSCVGETGKRGNAHFKGKEAGAKWEFAFCPYCGGRIVEVFPEEEE